MDIKLLSTTNLNGADTISITAFTDEYSLYGFTFSGIQAASGAFGMRFNEGGTAASGSTDYSEFRRVGTDVTEWVDGHSNSTSSYMWLNWQGLTSTGNMGGFGYIYGSQNSNRFTTMFSKSVFGSTSNVYHAYSTGRLEKNSIVDGVTLLNTNAVNFTNGKFSLYGYK